MGSYWPSVLCGIFVIGLLWAEVTENRRMQWLFKPAAAAMFVLQALLLGALGIPFGQAILAGLVLCMIGDVLLIRRESELLFKLGIGAFMLGHVAYIAAFSISGIDASMRGLRLLVILVVLLGVGRWLLRHIPRDMLTPVGFYMIVIMGMVYTGLGAVAAGATWLIGLAAIMFAISDLAVARDRFMKQSPINAFIITPLYFGAQVLFAVSV